MRGSRLRNEVPAFPPCRGGCDGTRRKAETQSSPGGSDGLGSSCLLRVHPESTATWTVTPTLHRARQGWWWGHRSTGGHGWASTCRKSQPHLLTGPGSVQCTALLLPGTAGHPGDMGRHRPLSPPLQPCYLALLPVPVPCIHSLIHVANSQ